MKMKRKREEKKLVTDGDETCQILVAASHEAKRVELLCAGIS